MGFQLRVVREFARTDGSLADPWRISTERTLIQPKYRRHDCRFVLKKAAVPQDFNPATSGENVEAGVIGEAEKPGFNLLHLEPDSSRLPLLLVFPYGARHPGG